MASLKFRPGRPMATRNTVLLAEDDGALRDLITEMLTRSGYRVLAAATPTEAQRMAREFAGRIDLLLTDVILPGMKGPSLAEAITRLRPEIRVLYMSGYTEHDPKSRQNLPADAPFLRKPFTTEGLLQTVSRAIAPPVAEAVH
jgi:DNA-binding NtrC family response regulator